MCVFLICCRGCISVKGPDAVVSLQLLYLFSSLESTQLWTKTFLVTLDFQDRFSFRGGNYISLIVLNLDMHITPP